MKEPVFTGCAAALVTPFKDGEVDFPALGRLIELQIAGGCAAVVVCATTGERKCCCASPTPRIP